MRSPFRPSTFAREGQRFAKRTFIGGWWWAAYGPAVGQHTGGFTLTLRSAKRRGAAAMSEFREELRDREMI